MQNVQRDHIASRLVQRYTVPYLNPRLASTDSWNVDKHGNRWRKSLSKTEYEFEPDVPLSRRKWPPQKEHIKTAAMKVLRSYEVSESDLRQVAEDGKLVQFRVEVPAFLAPNKEGVSRVTRVVVLLDLEGHVVSYRPLDCVPFPNIVARYAKLVQSIQKTNQLDNLKGYFNPGLYVRFGKWSGVSTFGLATHNEEPDEWRDMGKTHELGVSVYGVTR